MGDTVRPNDWWNNLSMLQREYIYKLYLEASYTKESMWNWVLFYDNIKTAYEDKHIYPTLPGWPK